jgi:predicted MPP superfamily phosphohydrolase
MSQSHRRGQPRLRQLALAAMDAALFDGLLAGWSYRLGLHGRLCVTTHELRVGAGKPLPAPLLLAFASDFHAGPTTHPKMYARLIEELDRLRPDALLLGGDYVSSKASHVDTLLEVLARCAPPLGKYAVLGNHDLWTDQGYIARQLARAGVEVLINRNVSLPPPFEQVSICGIDDPWTGRVDARCAFRGAGSVRILLSHSPDGLTLLNGERFDVAFAGHTHGGQIAYRDGRPIGHVAGRLSRRYSRGRFEIGGNGPLIVSRGVGCSNLPIRINADPELVLCKLRPQAGGASLHPSSESAGAAR